METEIVECPIQFHLHGKSSFVENNSFGEVGMKLMNEMWMLVKQTGTATTGINHWVYLPDGRMFVGVELLPDTEAPVELESLAFELQRYLKHIHQGPYQELPDKWKALKEELAARGELATCDETIKSPALEIYGHHHCDDPSQLETTILIGLQKKHA